MSLNANNIFNLIPLPKVGGFQQIAKLPTVPYQWFVSVSNALKSLQSFIVAANSGTILSNVTNVNFVNTSTVTVEATQSGQGAVNIAFTSSGGGGGFSQYEADVYANGTIVLANANLNFNNTATVNVSAKANGSTQANLSFNVNSSGVIAVANSSNLSIVYESNGQAQIDYILGPPGGGSTPNPRVFAYFNRFN